MKMPSQRKIGDCSHTTTMQRQTMNFTVSKIKQRYKNDSQDVFTPMLTSFTNPVL